MASLGDLTLFISAETDRAQKDIDGLGKSADRVTSKKREFDFDFSKARNNIRNFKRELENVGRAAKVAFKVASQEPFLDDEIESVETLGRKIKQIGPALNTARKPGDILAKTFEGIGRSTISVVNGLAKIGFALYGLKQITGVLQAAFGGFFKATVGQNIRLREQILKTQTALASTNNVYEDGKLISDPLKAIEALTGKIEERIVSIRERSLDLAGVTSSEVIEVFGIVSQQMGQIGGSLKDAEDLAISFSAALGTFGIPLHQARQEVGSILRGDITHDSYLAKALVITPEHVKKAKNSTEGLVKFLERKLEAAVAGQAIAAKSFSGVVSNLVDFQELIGQRFGEPLLDPLLAALNKVYAMLTSVKEQAFGAAEALGSGLGRAASFIGVQVSTDTQKATGEGALGKAGAQVEDEIRSVGAQIAALGAQLEKVFSNIFLLAAKAVAVLGKGIKELAGAFVGLNVGIFKSLVNTFELLLWSTQGLFVAVGDLLGVYADFLNMPIIGWLAEVGAQFKLLETLGVGAVVKFVMVFSILKASWAKIVGFITGSVSIIKGVFAEFAAFSATVFAALAQSLAVFATSLGASVPAAKALSVQLAQMSASANAASASMAKLSVTNNFLVNGMKNITKQAIIFNLKMAAVVAIIAIAIKVWGDYKRHQEALFKAGQADKAFKDLAAGLADVTEKSSEAAQAQKELALALIDSQLAVDKKAWIDATEEVEKYAEEVKKVEEARDNKFNAFHTPFMKWMQGPKGKSHQEVLLFRMKKKQAEALAEYEKRMVQQQEANRIANLKKDIETRSKEHGKLSEKLAKQELDLNRKVLQDKFNAEMELAQARIEHARSLAQEEIELVANRNRELIKGEEGASATALAGLADYAKSRAETEAGIEAKRAQRVIAIQRLENEIANYKFQINTKIVAMRKQGARIDQAAADYVKKVWEDIIHERNKVSIVEAISANKALPLTGGDPRAVSGNTGNSDGPHVHLQSTNEQQLLNDALKLIQFWQAIGEREIYIDGKHVGFINDVQVLMDLLKKQKENHSSRTADNVHAIDIAVPEGTPIPGVPLQKDLGEKAGFGSYFPSGTGVFHMMNPKNVTPRVQTKEQLAALEKLMQAPKIQTPDMQGVIDAKRALSATVEDLAASQEKLAMLALDNKLQEVIEGLAPKAVVEKYEDAVIHAQELGRVLKENNGITVERAQILADIAAREKIVRRELAETIEGVMDTEGIAHEKKLKIIEEWKAKVEETIHGNEKLKIKSYADEKTARLEHLDIAKKIAAVEAMARDAKAGTLNTKTNWITGHAQMQAGSTYDRSDRARIVTQGQLDARYAQLDDQGHFSGEGGAENLAGFQQFSETSLFNAERQAEMDGMMERFGQLSEIASGVGSAISTAFTQGFADILTGAKSVQEVLGNMFQGIADSFMQMAQKIIAEMIKMLILKTMLKIFGLSGTEVATDTGTGSFSGFESMSSGGFDFNTTPKGFSWPAMAKGGIVTGPTAAIIGEGGQNEAVVPLPNGKSIPVDFGKKGAGGDIQTNITVNVDQSGSTDTQVDGDSANKLGKAIDGAVKRVIMEERRSGGLLHNGRR